MTKGSSQHFVKILNISNTVEIGHLKELLQCFGQVKQINMHQIAKGERLCIAEFGTFAESQAVTSLSGTKVGGLQIQVRQADFSEVVSIPGNVYKVDGVLATNKDVNDQGKILADHWRDTQINRTIYVGNLSHHITEEHIRTFFKAQGSIRYIKMAGKHMNSNYCFVEFLNATSAQRAHALNGSNFHGRPLRIGRVKNPVAIPGVESDILNNPIKLKQAVLSARLALEALARKNKPNLPSEKVKIVDRDSNKRRSWSKSSQRHKSRSRSRSIRRHRPRSTSRSNRRHRSRPGSRSRDRRRLRDSLETSQSRSRSVKSRRRRRRSSRSQSRGRGKRSRSRRGFSSHKTQPKLKMVYDGFNWHPVDSALGQAMKEGEKVGAAGPKVGSSPGYVLGKGFLGSM